MYIQDKNGNKTEICLSSAGNIVSDINATGDKDVPNAKTVKDYVDGTILYENEVGTNGNVQLSEGIKNRTIEVFYYFKNSATLAICGSRKFSNPVGKLITLGIGDGHYDSGTIYGKYGSYTVSENELTVRTKGGYYYGVNNGFNNTENSLYITKIVAYGVSK